MTVLEVLFILTYFCGTQATDVSELQTEWEYSAYQENFPFFTAEFDSRLRAWNETLINASRYCSKLNASGFSTNTTLKILFPSFDTVDPEEEFLKFETFHPVLVRQKSRHDLATIAYLSILELWPLLVLCFSCAALAGMIIWVLDSGSNPEQFPRRFWRGIADGMWWAVVTMTTVGYGDKAPKSLLARLVASVWMVAGIILLTMFTAQVSARLVTQELDRGNHLFGKKIGVPPGLSKSYYVDDQMTYSIVEEISDPSESARTSTEEMDSVVLFHCDDKELFKTLRVLQFLPQCEVSAALLFCTSDPFADDDCANGENFDDMAAVKSYIKCMKTQTRLARNYPHALTGNQRNKASKSSSCKDLLEENEKLKFQFQWVYFKDLTQYLIPFGAVVGTLMLASIIGTIWDCFHKKEIYKSATKRDLKLMMSSADQSAGSMFERNAAKEEKSSLKAATQGDEKISTLEMHESHLPCNVK